MFRKVDVWIGGRKGMTPVMIPGLMQLWVRQANKDKGLSEIKRSHISFEHVHPFIDGNGRMGRMLMLWQWVKNDLPITVIYEKKKYEYYKWFETPTNIMDS